MVSKILTISDRGQITLPPIIRKILGSSHIEIVADKKSVTIRPVKIDPLPLKESFIKEMEESWADYKKTGKFYTLEEMKKKYNLK